MIPAAKSPEKIQAFAPAGLAATKFAAPRSTMEACDLLAEAHVKKLTSVVLAGGTDWIVDRHLMPIERAGEVDLVVDVTGIAGFGEIAIKNDAGEERLLFGGGVTYWNLRTNALVTRSIPMLSAMAKDVGAVQIQTRGTLAGNVASASPAADGVAALMALDARLTLQSATGVRVVPLEGFFTGYRKTLLHPGELIVEIDVRVPRPSAWARWRKVGTRLAQAISKVALASVVGVTDGTIRYARFGAASVAATTHALPRVRAYLEGRALADVDDAALEAAVTEDITPIDDVRSTGEYRLHVAKALVKRAIEAP